MRVALVAVEKEKKVTLTCGGNAFPTLRGALRELRYRNSPTFVIYITAILIILVGRVRINGR